MAERHLIGADPFDTEEIWFRLHQGDFLRGGDIGGIVLSGIDQALYDIQARFFDVPVYRLVGGACRDRVPVYANGWYSGGRSPDTFAASAIKMVEAGHTALKFDPFGAGLFELSRAERLFAISLVEAVRAAVGAETELFIEGHARFTLHEAVAIASALEPYDVGWFEEPLPWTHIEHYSEVKGQTSIPIAGGEHFHDRYDFRRLFELRAVDIIQPDICVAGGFTEIRKIAAQAEMHSMMVAPHNSNSPFCTTASAHLAFGIPNLKIVETFDSTFEPYVFDAIEGALTVENGSLGLPTAPGLGITLNDEVFAEHPPSFRPWNIFAEGWERRDRTVQE